MYNGSYRNRSRVVHLVDEAVIADAEAVPGTALQAFDSSRSRVVGEGFEGALHTILLLSREPGYLLLRPAFDAA